MSWCHIKSRSILPCQSILHQFTATKQAEEVIFFIKANYPAVYFNNSPVAHSSSKKHLGIHLDKKNLFLLIIFKKVGYSYIDLSVSNCQINFCQTLKCYRILENLMKGLVFTKQPLLCKVGQHFSLQLILHFPVKITVFSMKPKLILFRKMLPEAKRKYSVTYKFIF